MKVDDLVRWTPPGSPAQDGSIEDVSADRSMATVLIYKIGAERLEDPIRLRLPTEDLTVTHSYVAATTHKGHTIRAHYRRPPR